MFNALDTRRIELLSWGFANADTRFRKFIQPATGTSTEERFAHSLREHVRSLVGRVYAYDSLPPNKRLRPAPRDAAQ